MKKKKAGELPVRYKRRKSSMVYGKITATLPGDLIFDVRQHANENQMTLSALIEAALRKVIYETSQPV